MTRSRTIDLMWLGLLLGSGFSLARSFPNGRLPASHATQNVDEQLPGPRNSSTGAAATAPHEIPARGWLAVAKRVAQQFLAHRLMAESAGVIFFVLLAIFPAIAAIVSLYGLFNDPATVSNQLAAISGILPSGGMDILKEEVTRHTTNGNTKLGFGLVLGLATSLWSSNQGMKALFDVLNVVYDEREKRGYVRLTLITLGFTFATLLFVVLAMAGVVVLPVVLNFVGFDHSMDTLLKLLRWPVMLAVISVLLSVLYRYGPSRERAKWRWVSWGGAFASIAWVLVSLGFSYYVSNFGSYNKTYGSLGAAIGFMTWIWISVMVVLLGAELNAELEHQTAHDTTTGTEQALGTRGATKADTVAPA